MRPFRSFRQHIAHLPEGLVQRLQQQLILAFEVLVKASMGQAGIPHDRCNRSPGNAFARTRREASFTIF